MSRGQAKRFTFGIFSAAVVAMGLLLWARLLLVTGHPRTAIAGEEVRQIAHAQNEYVQPTPAP